MRNRSDDRCTTRTGTGRTKTAAGITVYLLEELSDARMRCAQLKKLVAEATDLIEKSEQRDHFFEVAAHLIHGVPDTLFRLEKALDAAAMSASRMDYEEIKQNLRPEKAQEMDQVLQDARLRYLTRRSQQLASPSAATAEIERIASVAEQTGNVPVADLLVLAATLELGVKTASESTEKTAADRLRDIARGASTEKSRVALAKALRTFLADALQPTAGQALQAVMQSANSREDVMEGFKQSNPDLTEEQLKEIADQWEANKNVVKDKAAAAPKADFFQIYHQMSADLDTFEMAWGRYSRDPVANAHKLADAMKYMKDLQFLAGVLIRNMEQMASGKQAAEVLSESKESRHEEGKSVDPTKDMSPEDAKKWHEMNEEHGDNFKTAFVPDALSAERVGLYVDSMRDRLLIAQRSLKSGDWRHFKISLRHFLTDLGAILGSVGLQSGADKLALVHRELVALPLGTGSAEMAPAAHMANDISANSREDVMEGFKQSNPDLTEEQLKEIADQWEANKNVVKDKAAAEEKLPNGTTLLVEMKKAGPAAWLVSKDGKGKLPISIGNAKTEEEAVEAAHKFLKGLMPKSASVEAADPIHGAWSAFAKPSDG